MIFIQTLEKQESTKMPISPNDPDYDKIMQAQRASAPQERKQAKKKIKNFERSYGERERKRYRYLKSKSSGV